MPQTFVTFLPETFPHILSMYVFKFEEHRDRALVLWFTPQVLSALGLGWESGELGTLFRSLTQPAGVHSLEPSPVPLSVSLSRKLESGDSQGPNPGTLMWNVSVITI